ncbi:MAG: hypothetical protein OSJ58_08950 [Dysosmobacter sp.]|uniref:hypothetical protein n=1 Tax=uncultured Oscillibacter sp. TaxID=876091 RepID=UPI00261A5179|nr:hypothetical protein [uncultured Oscillibacter sp.]MCX4371946.1 hypothetical protein [Dysosmobacter sp.]
MKENTINTMLCPFRVNGNGNFCECYGKGCMAYYEYQSFVPDPAAALQTSRSTPVVTCICKRMAQPVTYGGCV